MRIRSHLDPTLFVIFLHIDASKYDDEFRALVRTLRAAKGVDISAVFEAFSDREHRTKRHELYHYWQGLRLPFLHMYAFMTYREAFLGVKELAKVEPVWTRWHELGFGMPSFGRLDVPMYITHDDAGGLAAGRDPPPSLGHDSAISPKDMLECAASIYDFQLSCQYLREMSDVQHFTRWRKRNPSYLDIFDLCARLFRSESLALRCILPLINASFHTSIPERAFIEFAARIWGNFVKPTEFGPSFLAQNEPCRWPELFRHWLAELPYDISEDEAFQSLAVLESRFFHMGRTLLGSSFGGEITHPFLGPNALAWERAVARMPALGDYIDLPGYVADPEVHDFATKADPPLWVVRIFFEDGESTAYAIGPGFVRDALVRGALSERSDSELRGFALDSISAYSAFRRAAGAHFTDASRTCHHSVCPYFELNYCNCYPLIPEQFKDCGFPRRLEEWISWERADG
jgi:hypothetical protein